MTLLVTVVQNKRHKASLTSQIMKTQPDIRQNLSLITLDLCNF